MKTTPRQTYRKRHGEDAAKLATVISEPWFERSMSFALAEMAASGKHLAIPGAGEFLNTLESLTEDDREMKRQPDPVLKTYEPGWKLPDVPVK